jgi:hypothetical protein
MQDPPAANHREADRHERAGGGQPETSIQHLIHNRSTRSYPYFSPQKRKNNY